MTKIFNTLLGAFVLLQVVSCVEWPQATLPEDQPLVHLDQEDIPKPVPVMEVNGGVVSDFEKNFNNWVISHPQSMGAVPEKGVMVLHCTEVGPSWEELTLTFPPMNFAEAKNLQLRARMDGYKIPTIRMDLIDVNGMMTNSRLAQAKIAPREGFLDYQFRYDNRFKQNWPFKGAVDSTQIVKIRMNFNGGAAPYTGSIYFDELRAVPSFE